MPDNDMSESENLADGFMNEDAAVRGWYACTLMHTLDKNSTIEETVKAIRADEKFMMRAICTPQDVIITIPMSGGYLSTPTGRSRGGVTPLA